jgi:hypothetical protein
VTAWTAAGERCSPDPWARRLFQRPRPSMPPLPPQSARFPAGPRPTRRSNPNPAWCRRPRRRTANNRRSSDPRARRADRGRGEGDLLRHRGDPVLCRGRTPDRRQHPCASSQEDIRSLVVSALVGVVGAVTPWNYPVDIYAWKLGPAIAAGYTMVAKPPHETPLAIGLVVQCFADAGLPAGVLNDLPGTGPEAGAALASHPRVRMMTATASTAAGQ